MTQPLRRRSGADLEEATVLTARRAVAVALAIPVALAGGCVGLSLLGPSVPGSEWARSLDRRTGQWLLDRSTPLPDCLPDGGPGAVAGRPAGEAVEGIYRFTDERGVTHYVDEEGRVPERYRAASKVQSLPSLTVYRGQYSRLRRVARGVAPVEPRPSSQGAGSRAVVYSAAWCGACKKTTAWLRGQGVVVEERDIDRDPMALAELVSIAGKDPAIPVTIIGGRAVGGFDLDGLRSALAAARR